MQRAAVVQGGGQIGHAPGVQLGQRIRQAAAFHHRQAARRPHAGPQGLGAEGRGTARVHDHCVKPEGRGGAHQRPHIAGVLHPLQRQIAPARVQGLFAVFRHTEDAEQPLMAVHSGQFLGHVLLDQVLFPAERLNFRGALQRLFGIEYYLYRAAPRQLRTEL